MKALRHISVHFLLLTVFLCTIGSAAAQDTAKKPAGDSFKKECATSPGTAEKSVTQRVIEAADGRIAYTATAGTFTVRLQDEDAEGSIFYVAYSADRQAPSEPRPVTFVVNGGPGAASAYLHLLALGPRIAPLNADGTIPPSPLGLQDNRLTWLSFTDLVFIDPVGTGYSRSAKDDGAKPFWQLNKDLESLVEFIRLYLNCENRWDSPAFLAGESYGGFRTASLPSLLASDIGLRLNGLILISPVLEFSFQDFDDYQPLPWALILPSYAATALHHGKSDLTRRPGQPLSEVLSAVEGAATGGFLSWLVRDGTPGQMDEPSVLRAISGAVGLSEDIVRRRRGRLSRRVFSRTLLEDSGRYVSIYDGTVAAIDPHPSSTSLRADDPVLNPLTTLLARRFGAYARGELNYQASDRYEVLNPSVSRHWEWMSGRRTQQGFRGAADSLKEAMSLDPALQVLIAHGYYDLVTPYLATSYTIRQMMLDAAIRPNLVERIYEGGHMLYTHEAARAAFYRDAQDLYGRALAPVRKGGRGRPPNG